MPYTLASAVKKLKLPIGWKAEIDPLKDGIFLLYGPFTVGFVSRRDVDDELAQTRVNDAHRSWDYGSSVSPAHGAQGR